MKEQELNKIINSLERNSSKDDAYFQYSSNHPDYAFIESNKDGILIFAKELLNATKDFDLRWRQKVDGDDNFIKIKTEDWYINDGFMLPLIKPVFEKKADIEPITPIKRNFKDNLIGWLYMTLVIIIIVFAFIGFFKVLSWIIDLF